MNFKEFLFTEEINLDDTATVYHRTKTINTIQNILKSGFKSGSGDSYGAGLYTTISLESQFNGYMDQYGSYIIKFQVTNLDEYLVFHPNIAKRIHGTNYKLSDQLKKFNLSNRFTSEYLDELDQQQEMTGIKDASNLHNFYEENYSWIASQLKGVIYYGSNDGYCLLKYEPVNDRTISILAYAEARATDKEKMQQLYQNQGWVTETNKLKIKELNRLSQDKRQQYAKITDNDEKIDELIRKAKDNVGIAKFLIQKYKLSDQNVEKLLSYATNKQEMVKLIIQNKTELSDDNVKYLIRYATEKQEILELIIEKKQELSDDNVENLLDYATNKQEMAEFIIQNKPELSDNGVYYLLSYATNRQKMAKIIIQYKPELSGNNVYGLLYYAPKKQEIAVLLQKDFSKISDDQVKNLLHYAYDRQEIAQIINQYHTKKTPEIEEMIKPYLNNS